MIWTQVLSRGSRRSSGKANVEVVEVAAGGCHNKHVASDSQRSTQQHLHHLEPFLDGGADALLDERGSDRRHIVPCVLLLARSFRYSWLSNKSRGLTLAGAWSVVHRRNLLPKTLAE